MNSIYENYLLTKNIVIEIAGEESAENISLILTRLYNDYGIVVDDISKVNRYVYGKVEGGPLGNRVVSEPFYRGFPHSVKKLSTERLLIDQMIHYLKTYGFGDFETRGHSIYEEDTIREELNEVGEIKHLRIVSEKEALEIVKNSCIDLLNTSRPLNDEVYTFVKTAVADPQFKLINTIENISSKNTVIRLISDLSEIDLCKFLSISDFIKLVDNIAYEKNQKLNKLNLTNKERRFLTKVLDRLFEQSDNVMDSVIECCENKQAWCGILHHIHYKSNPSAVKEFISIMRGKNNFSVPSRTENLISRGNIGSATRIMQSYKGTGYVLRNLNYLLSRCTTDSSVKEVFECLSGKCNPIIYLQLLNNFIGTPKNDARRVFSFTKHSLLTIHKETEDESHTRQSHISAVIRETAIEELKKLSADAYANTVNGSVYIDNKLKNITMPLYESDSSLGIGVLPKGSRIPLDGKNIRAFTYWEKVNDIDLSCFALRDDFTVEDEFSWRTFGRYKDDAIVFSGDVTDGYDGGSEYFDIDINKFKNAYDNCRYLLFMNNVFSRSNFSNCLCTAGVMLREDLDRGEIYEPKTVRNSFTINADSTMACLFAIDLKTNELVWLNTAVNSIQDIAADTDFEFIRKYVFLADTLSIERFMGVAATEVVDNPENANIVISNDLEGENVIHSHDVDKLLALLNLPSKG